MKYLLIILIMLFSVSCYEEVESKDCGEKEVFNTFLNMCVHDLCWAFDETGQDKCIEGCYITDHKQMLQCNINR